MSTEDSNKNTTTVKVRMSIKKLISSNLSLRHKRSKKRGLSMLKTTNIATTSCFNGGWTSRRHCPNNSASSTNSNTTTIVVLVVVVEVSLSWFSKLFGVWCRKWWKNQVWNCLLEFIKSSSKSGSTSQTWLIH